MIIPQYWAEGRVQDRTGGKQVTVRRFGWSDTTQADAQARANRRAQEALDRIHQGEKLLRREPKLPRSLAAPAHRRALRVSRARGSPSSADGRSVR